MPTCTHINEAQNTPARETTGVYSMTYFLLHCYSGVLSVTGFGVKKSIA